MSTEDWPADRLPTMLAARSFVDPRDLKGAAVVSDRNGYYDSQNIVAVGGRDGAPLVLSVVLHHSENREGGPGLALFGTRSFDRGRTWSALRPIDSPERQSHDGYQLVQRLADGTERIFVFYGWNVGSQYPAGSDESLIAIKRTDMQLDEGYWFRVSDDQGETWGDCRYLIEVRRTRIDRENPWGGSTMGMFLCDKPSVINGSVYLAFQKTRDGAGETPGSEVFFLRSRNLLTVDDLNNAEWETLPDQDEGLRSPSGELSLGEEPHVLGVGTVYGHPGRLMSLWRSEVGRLAAAYSDDGGSSWDEPFWLTYEGLPLGAGGTRPIRNPRGSITPYRRRDVAPTGAGEFVMLFYNNARTDRLGYTGRRVYWLTVGRESPGGVIRWNQPEIALWWDGTGFEDRPDWNPDWAIVDGPGYPDWVEFDDGTLAFVESNKLAVRFHVVDPRLLHYLRHQPELSAMPTEGLVLDHVPSPGDPGEIAAPVLADLRAGGGFTMVVLIEGDTHHGASRQVLVSALSNVTAALGEEPTDRRITKGYEIAVAADGEVELFVTDGFDQTFRHATTIGSDGVNDGSRHVVAFVVDGGPKVVSVVVDEHLDDGGEHLPQGWAFVPPGLGEIGGSRAQLHAGGRLVRYALFDRALLTSEAISAARSMLASGVDQMVSDLGDQGNENADTNHHVAHRENLAHGGDRRDVAIADGSQGDH